MREHQPPGAALAVAYHGRLVYARGFGYADVEKREPVRPASLFRIASVSKPFCAATVMQLIEQGKLKMEERVFPLLKLEPHLERGARLDPRWHEITVRHCLQHTGGWNRDKSFDPMSAQTAEERRQGPPRPAARSPPADHPLHDGQAVGFRSGHGLRLFQFRLLRAGPGDRGRYGQALPRGGAGEDSRPRWAFAACNWARTCLKDRAAGEVKYYDSSSRTGRAISGPKIGEPVAPALRRRMHRDAWTPTAVGSPRRWTWSASPPPWTTRSDARS